MKLTVERGLTIGLALVLLLIVLICSFSSSVTAHLLDYTDHVSARQRVREKALAVKSLVDERQAAMRGYVITGNEEYLGSHFNSMAKSEMQEDELLALLTADPETASTSHVLLALIAEEREFTKRVIAARRDSGFEAAARLVAGGEGNRVVNNIRQKVDQVLTEEDLLKGRQESQIRQTHENARRMLWIMGTGSVIGLVVTALAGFQLQNGFKRRLLAEEQCRQTADGFAALVNSAKDYAIFKLDNEGIVQSWNVGAQRIKGYMAEEIIGKSFKLFYTAEDLRDGKPPRELKIARETGKYEEDGWRLRKDGSRFWANVTIQSQQDSSGRQIGFSKITRDLTERRNAEQRNVDARASEAANRAKSDFLANMSHEIRTPMTAIVGFSDMILQQQAGAPNLAECVQTIRRNASHLLELINDILDLSKIEQHQMTVENIPCEISVLLADIIPTMRPRAVEKGLEFEVTVKCPIPRFIRTDPGRLRQILVNLLGNAIKFTSAGKITMTLCAEGGEPNHSLCIEVTDSGVGMTPDELGRLFQPFRQADESITRKFGGTGLGLTISRQLAHLLGGEIQVSSEPGAGSVFKACVDAGSFVGVEMLAELNELMVTSAPLPDEWENIPLHGRILLAEDGRDNQRLISAHLRACGAEVAIAENGQIAVDMVATSSFDLILMDMQMPVMDGYTAVRHLRGTGCTLPIVALTAYAMAEDRKKCIDSGCTDYLSKPIGRQILLKTARKYMDKIRLSAHSAEPLGVTDSP